MIIRTRNLLPIVLLMLGLFVVSCSGEGKGILSGKTVGGQAKTLSVWIIPDEPTIENELLAVVSGDQDLVYFEWDVNGVKVEGADSERFKPRGLKNGDRVTVTVSAPKSGLQRSGTVMIRNARPVVNALRFAPEKIRAGVEITVTPEAMDLDGDYIRFGFRWFVNGEELYMTTGPVLDKNLIKRGDRVSVKVTPFDGVDFGRAFAASVAVPNGSPEFTSVPPSGFRGRVYSYRAIAEDPDGDEVSFSLLRGPVGMSMDREGLITWPIGPGDAGVHMVEVVADDGFGEKATQSYEIEIEIPEGS